MSCENDNGLTIKKYILSGETGADGPIGPAGEGVELPIDATDVNVTNIGYDTVQEALDFLLLVPMAIQNFSTPTVLFENRLSTHASADFNLVWEWTLNKTIIPPGNQTLIGPIEMTPVTLEVGDRTKTVTMTNFNTTRSFNLTVTDELGTSVFAIVEVAFTNNIYFGDVAIPGAVNSAFILSLIGGGSPSLQTTNIIDLYSTTDPAANPKTYFWFASAVSNGVPIFKSGGFLMDMQAAIPVTFTNNFGHVENYNVYRSTNHSLSTIFVNIT